MSIFTCVIALDIVCAIVHNERYMKITIYTISDCYFSKQEKDYLQAHGLTFEERNLEENRDFLTEMLTISNNFAGTPVTKIEKDDGQIVVLKGFTTDEFDKTFGFAPSTDAVVINPAPAQPMAAPVAPAVAVPAPVVPAVAPPAPAAPVAAPPAPPAPAVDMNAIAAQIEQLKKLQESLAAQTAPKVAPAPVASTVAPPAPVVAPPAPVAPVAAPPAPEAQNVDDSLAAILAELQTKINSSQNSGGTGTPPTTQ